MLGSARIAGLAFVLFLISTGRLPAWMLIVVAFVVALDLFIRARRSKRQEGQSEKS